MHLPSAMFCGAADTRGYIDSYFKVCSALNLGKPANFIDGNFSFEQFGGKKAYEKNSVRTIDESDIIVFVIRENFGEITWEVEFEHAVEQGKNFIILCLQKTYGKYKMSSPAELQESKMLSKIYYLENQNRLSRFSIVAFEENTLEKNLTEQISHLFRTALQSKETLNKRDAFINVHLHSANYRHYHENDLTEKNELICKSILFDPYEHKELRKRAMEFFVHRKTLSQEELINLCMDSEQGIARKTVSRIGQLADTEKIKLGDIFEEIVAAVVLDGEVGLIRRCLRSMSELDIMMAVRLFPNFFPADDVGTPKRIVRIIEAHFENLQQQIKEGKLSRVKLLDLLNLCSGKEATVGDWKDVAKALVAKLEE